ncbi:hypothetical protein O3M35_002043 [Rhynocoris fuscipes]|uniref:Uncharacterized protein n=1 Tax=Rhynocoris fuscipes TaxID=488301 RepID=A0AAW1CVJ2_9HEMI
MRSIIIVAAILMTLALAEAIVCPDSYCDKVKCSENLTQENCHGELMAKSSFCGCCPVCVQYIKPGDYCNEILKYIIGPGNNFLAYKCPPGFICAMNRCSPLL